MSKLPLGSGWASPAFAAAGCLPVMPGQVRVPSAQPGLRRCPQGPFAVWTENSFFNPKQLLGSRLRIMVFEFPQIATMVKPQRVSAVGGGGGGRPFILTQISVIPVPETLRADSIYKQV